MTIFDRFGWIMIGVESFISESMKIGEEREGEKEAERDL
jgi:hypothetical protein